MTITKSIIGILLFQTLSLFGDVKFDFIYADEPGTGFHIRPEAKAALEEVGRLIGSNWLKQHKAKLVIEVVSEEDASKLYLANAHPVAHKKDYDSKFVYFAPARKIILGQRNRDEEFDATLTVNFHHPFVFGDILNDKQLDFKAILIHEITHTLGFVSRSCECPRSFLSYNLDDFVKQLFVYGINAIEGKTDARKLRKLEKKLELLKSTNVDIDAQILNKGDSPLAVLHMGLILEFKHALENKSPLTARPALFKEFSNNLAQKGMTIQEFIKFQNHSFLPLMSEMFSGFHDLSKNASDPLKEKKLRKILITYNILHDGLDIIHKFNKSINNLAEKNQAEVPNVLSCIQDILRFYAQYLITGKNDIKEIERSNALLSLLGITVEEIAHTILEIENERETFEMEVKSETGGHTFLDQFITQKNGKKFFDRKVNNKIIKSCLLENGRSEKQLYFSGPYTLKYIGSPIALNGMDASHISPSIKSIMNPVSNGGLESREWDAHTTAIMLDLGYKVDNHWTRLWEHGKAAEKKRSQDKEKARKTKAKKSKKDKAKKEANKAHRADIKNRP